MNQSPPSQHPRIAFIKACWHDNIVERCRQSFLSELADYGWDANSVDCYEVPGSFDIPLLAKKLAHLDRYQAIIAAGFVVDGGIYRHDFVAASVIDALMRVQLDTDVPVISAVLTPHHYQEHNAHNTFFEDHFVVKGQEAAAACVKIVNNFSALNRLHQQASSRLHNTPTPSP